jgi:hypothetical protein
MTIITDDHMKQMIATTKNYSVVILKSGPNRDRDDLQKIIWEHGRRNFVLRAEGVLSIVCPVSDGTTFHGLGIFNRNEEETKKIMEDDPGVKAGIFTYEIHPARSFPGDSLP